MKGGVALGDKGQSGIAELFIECNASPYTISTTLGLRQGSAPARVERKRTEGLLKPKPNFNIRSGE